ncbi:Acyl-CoA N-acyltransferase with RING/FYVE/PHD-type zinc finger domain [Forsythia ovata]|uniref:Acyl-CoA N-acyltransferase with RING/FYVE/PHD-type zinc finger domain n=1 Tax=Forsythia ovata TaxID=205694 RepID=A0ABD1T422_9LAMI
MAKDMDSGEIVVSSIRSGMKREFAMMMKAQSEIGVVSSGQRRVTRSQSSGGCSKDAVESGNKIGKEGRGSDAKRRKKDAEEKSEGEDAKKLEFIDVLDNEGGANSDMVDVVVNDEEKLKFLDNEERENIDMVEVVVNEEEELKILENRPTIEEKKGEVEITVTELNGVVQPMYIDSSFPQVGGNEIKPGCEEYKTAGGTSEVGCERTGGMLSELSEKQVRRFTRSALKLQETAELVSVPGEMKADGVESDGAVTSTSSPSKLEMKMSKKVELKRVPRKLKDLLDTGLLEGLPVRYVHRSKRGLESGLRGAIRGSGILCSCDECKETKVVTPNQFELHAGSANKRPPEYIYLENGKTLCDVLNACKNAPLDALEMAIQNTIGRSESKVTTFCLNCKGLIPVSGIGRSMLLCDSCVWSKESDPSPTEISDTTHRSPLSASTKQSSPVSSSSLPRIRGQGSAQMLSSSHSRIKGQGRLTRKDLRMHRLVFEEDVLPERTALAYYVRGQKRLEGYKEGFGIFCFCCDKVVSPSQFEAHAGFASRRKPYMNIFTSNGVSLHELSLRLSKERRVSSDENDDLCTICLDGGDLLCCDNCPRAFHAVCVSLPSIPQGSWYCKYCQNMFLKEKFAERNTNAIAAGRVAGVDALEQITQRCIRIVETTEADAGGCAVCGGDDFSASGFNDRTVIICDQCEKDYHVGCLREQKIDDLKELPKDKWFCCTPCSNIHSALQNLVIDGEQMLPEALLNLVKKKHEKKSSEVIPEVDVRWRLLSGKLSSEDTRVWLSGAVTIFHEQFDPIADSSTSRLDLIPHMVYGRPFKDQDFGGMYCAILTVNSLVVSAGIVRIFGQEVAELPLVATLNGYQGKGYFQSLFFCIENLLTTLKVKSLVLPAADEAESLWKNKFGFEKISEEKLEQYKKEYQMMIFQGTTVLHKAVS